MTETNKAGRFAKVTGKWLLRLVVFFILLIGVLYFAIQLPVVQTWLAQKATNYLSKELNTKVTVRGVNIEFFTKAILEGVYVEDQHGDTLLHAEELKVDVRSFNYDQRKLTLRDILLRDALIRLKKYPNEKGLSYRFILMYFKNGPKSEESSAPWKVDMGGITFQNVRIDYIDTRDTVNDPGMDYENIRVSKLNAKFRNIQPMGDSASVDIESLTAIDRCGFEVTHFNSILVVSEQFAHFKQLQIETPNGSAIHGDLRFVYDSLEAIEDDFIHLVRMQAHLDTTTVEMADIAYFSSDLSGIHEKLKISGDVSGTVERLRCKNIRLEFGRNSLLAGNFSFNGLPDIETTDMNFRIRDLRTSYADLGSLPIPPFISGDSLLQDLPVELSRLGSIRFNGIYEGFLTEFVAHGRFDTELGQLTLNNLAMSRPNPQANFVYNGQVSATQFDFGTLLDISGLSYATGELLIKGSGLQTETVDAQMEGTIAAVNWNGYTYQNINIRNGYLLHTDFDGDLFMRDPNAGLAFHGSVDFGGEIPIMDFEAEIDSANLGALGFLDAQDRHILTTGLQMRLKGSNIDNMTGTIGVERLDYVRNGEVYRFSELTLNAQNFDDSTRTISLESDIARATIKGKFELLELQNTVSNLLSDYLPAYFPPPAINSTKSKVSKKEQQFTYYVTFNQNTRPLEVLVPGLQISPGTFIRGSFDTQKRKLDGLLSSAGSIFFNGIRYSGIDITANNNARNCELSGRINRIILNDTIGMSNVLLKNTAANDSLLTRLSWSNKSQRRNNGELILLTHFLGGEVIDFNLLTANLYFNDSLWVVAPGNLVRLNGKQIEFSKMRFRSGAQSIGLDGLISENTNDRLIIGLNRFDLSYLNYFSQSYDLTFSGTIDGETYLSSIYKTPIFTSNTTFSQLFINKQKIGDGQLDAIWDKSLAAVYLHGVFSRGILDEQTNELINNIAFDGYYYPSKKEENLDVDLVLRNIELQLLQPFLKEYCSLMKGSIGGRLHAGGTLNKPKIKGNLLVFIKKATIDYLGISVRAEEQVVEVEDNSFFFDDYVIVDRYGNKTNVYGHLYHDNFRKFQFDMDFIMDRFLTMETTDKQNELYYGRVFASGFMNIFGYVDEKITIDINAQTRAIDFAGKHYESEFNIPMTYTSEVDESEFVYFTKDSVSINQKGRNEFRNNGVEVHIDAEITPDAQVNVIFDKTVGDVLKAKGGGNLRMDVGVNGDFTMQGDYTVESGDYTFTLKNVPLANFKLKKGGKISWSGDPEQAQIDASAIYKANASVEPFFPFDTLNAAYRRNYPVDVIMQLDSNLMNPQISFDIQLPTADQNIQETVRSYTQIDLERNKQVLSLMVLNSFITPQEFRGDANGGTNVAGGTGATVLSNFLSGTLNNWLGQMNNDITMQVKYRPNDDLTTNELKVYMATQILNNRITIDGNFGVQNQQQTSNTTAGQLVGDVNVEYKVTNDGKVRLRAFNRSNDNTLLNTAAPFTQGVGVFYREDFDSFEELMERYSNYLKQDAKTADERRKFIAPTPADTTQTDSLNKQ